MSNEPKHTATPISKYVQEWINSHEPDTFVKNEYGNYIYSAKHSSLNLVVFFEQIVEDYTESLRAERAELTEALRVGRNELERAKMSLIQSDYSEESSTIQSINNALTTLAKYEKP